MLPSSLLILAATTSSSSASSLAVLPFLTIYMCFAFVFYCIVPIIGIIGFVIWVIMLVDLVQRPNDQFPAGSNDPKTMWLLIVLLSGMIGSIVYYFVIYKKYPHKMEIKS